MYIIYRVMKKGQDYSDNEIIDQNVIEAKSKDDFKEAIKLIYGDDIKFANNKSVKEGDLFISIISYDCDNPEDYMSFVKMKCACCGKEFITSTHFIKKINEYWENYLKFYECELSEELINEINKMTFCSDKCRYKKEEEIRKLVKQKAINQNGFANEWVTRESATDDSGYIYMITKKSTGEFYVGKTNALPMFRWVQHLKTDRFPLEQIVDYKFEILEKCKDKLTDRETHWINVKRNENPSKCLNIAIPKEKE